MVWDLSKYNEILKSLTEFKGGEALTRIAPELMGILELGNFEEHPEYLPLMGGKPWVDRIFVAASVGNFSSAFYRASVGTLVQITHVWQEAGAAAINVGSVPALATAGWTGPTSPGQSRRDGRSRSTLGLRRFTRQGAQAISTGSPIVLSAGILIPIRATISGDLVSNDLVFESAAVNQVLAINAIGYERPATTSEFDQTIQ